MDTHAKLKSFLSAEIARFDPDRSLIEQVNSLELYALVTKLEKAFGVRIHSLEINQDKFRGVDTLTSLLEEKLKRK